MVLGGLLCAVQVLDTLLPLRWVRTQFVLGAWWQPMSAQLVHLGWTHALLNALALVLLLSALRPWLAARILGLATLGGAVGVAAVLLLDTQCATYAGASGALHGLWAGSAWALLRDTSDISQRRGARHLGTGLLVALVLKLLVQRWGGGWTVLTEGPVYLPAHEAGALGGLALVALVAALRPAQAP